MWPFKSNPKPERINTTADLLRALDLLTRRYEVPLQVQMDWRHLVNNADFGAVGAVTAAVLAILTVEIARRG